MGVGRACRRWRSLMAWTVEPGQWSRTPYPPHMTASWYVTLWPTQGDQGPICPPDEQSVIRPYSSLDTFYNDHPHWNRSFLCGSFFHYLAVLCFSIYLSPWHHLEDTSRLGTNGAAETQGKHIVGQHCHPTLSALVTISFRIRFNCVIFHHSKN